jgi:hypothetical protein
MIPRMQQILKRVWAWDQVLVTRFKFGFAYYAWIGFPMPD